ncbi:MAG: queuosine salvage family protein [Acidobacteria bacterium]|nr:queuosine salvage family protein [Acidobacteriota bacterium]
MSSSLFDQIRGQCAWVAGQGRSVRINDDRIRPYAESLLDASAAPAQLDPAHHYVGHGPDTIAFILTLDTVNFGSGYFPHLRKRPGLSGYFTVASSLNDHFIEQGPLSAERLAGMTPQACTHLFRQEPVNEVSAELMALFANAFNDLGRLILDRFGGSFVGLVEAAGESAEELIQILAAMPFFRDVQPYQGREVPFYKRAQLTAADLALAMRSEPAGRFRDLNRLTIFADNLVPHVLRMDAVLDYDVPLLERIERQDLIAPGSSEEIEIRACAVHAVERIREELATLGKSVTSVELDYLLWNRGQGAAYKAQPRHRCRCVFY